MKPKEKVIPDFLLAVVIILIFVGGGFLSGHYWWPKVEIKESKSNTIQFINCDVGTDFFECKEYINLQSERQKLACEKANGYVETVSLEIFDIKVTVCTTLEGVYKWNGDKFILEKEL